ncbi:hypothetical protein [Photobacterium sanguinicancri]|uniref:Uncharacterized protein n=1 Tax=Photobacterium sanguinicancri TaxID=875932 RepID=A0ABX4FSK7_9GAMM|nr:hypothetical protein [Photobacterium sanguinicancri]OZS41868.1 hypothetical protein ASV53_21430 [Photobacterium sanguinicancri]
MSSIESLIFAVLLLNSFICMVLYIAFGQITVRKLRRNKNTKDSLGIEYASGWDIINVAQALSLPTYIIRKLRSSSLSPLYADREVLIENTTRFDRLLAFVFYWLLMFTGVSLPLLALADYLDLFSV